MYRASFYRALPLFVLVSVSTPARAQFLGSVSTNDEIALGRQAAMEVERRYPVSRDAAAQRRVDAIGQRVARSSGRRIPYHFRVLDLREVNAFALPGGYIYVNRGALALARSDSELGGVLAHEVAHVVRRHGIKQAQHATAWGVGLGVLDMVLGGRGTGAALANLAGQMVGQGVFLKHSRDAEREADRVGVGIMQRAGMDPRGMLTFLHRLAQVQRTNPGQVATFFSTHPSLAERERNVGDLIGRRADAVPSGAGSSRALVRTPTRSADTRYETAVDSQGHAIRFRR